MLTSALGSPQLILPHRKLEFGGRIIIAGDILAAVHAIIPNDGERRPVSRTLESGKFFQPGQMSPVLAHQFVVIPSPDNLVFQNRRHYQSVYVHACVWEQGTGTIRDYQMRYAEITAAAARLGEELEAMSGRSTVQTWPMELHVCNVGNDDGPCTKPLTPQFVCPLHGEGVPMKQIWVDQVPAPPPP